MIVFLFSLRVPAKLPVRAGCEVSRIRRNVEDSLIHLQEYKTLLELLEGSSDLKIKKVEKKNNNNNNKRMLRSR